MKQILFFSFIKFTLWTLLNLHFVNNSRGVRIRDFFDALHLKDKKRFLFTICDGENRTTQRKREEWNGLILTLLLFILSLWMKWYLECLMLNWKFLHLVLILGAWQSYNTTGRRMEDRRFAIKILPSYPKSIIIIRE